MAGILSGCSHPANDMSAPHSALGDEDIKSALRTLRVRFGTERSEVRILSPRLPLARPSSSHIPEARFAGGPKIADELGPLVLVDREPLSLSGQISATRADFADTGDNVACTSSECADDCQCMSHIRTPSHTPPVDRPASKAPVVAQASSPTIAQCARLYLQREREIAARRGSRALKPQTLASCASYSRHLVGPAGGRLLSSIPVADLEPWHVAEWHEWLVSPRGPQLSGATADTVLSFLSSVCQWARLAGHANWPKHMTPCHGQRRHGGRPRTKDIPLGSLRRWLAAVHDAEQNASMRWRDPAISIIGRAPFIMFRVLLLTGARPSEARTALWSEVDLDDSVIKRQTSKTGIPRRIVLTEQANTVLLYWRVLLNSRPETRHLKHVFPSIRGDFEKPISPKYKCAWKNVCEAYGDDELWVYDLRRTAARTAIEAGISAADVACWLGNSPSVLKKHYAAHADDPAANRAASAAARRYRRYGAVEARLGGAP